MFRLQSQFLCAMIKSSVSSQLQQTNAFLVVGLNPENKPGYRELRAPEATEPKRRFSFGGQDRQCSVMYGATTCPPHIKGFALELRPGAVAFNRRPRKRADAIDGTPENRRQALGPRYGRSTRRTIRPRRGDCPYNRTAYQVALPPRSRATRASLWANELKIKGS